MKTIKLSGLLCGSMILLAACNNGKHKWDASGVFEATEVMVSAEANGKIMEFTINEGDRVVAGEQLGLIDTTLLFLQKKQLESSRYGTLSNTQDVAKQIASLNEQIAWQEKELIRFQKLFKENAGNQKNIDDIENNLKVLRKELVARKSSLGNSNKSISEQGAAIENNIKLLTEQIKRALISSPINGVILTKYAEQGEFAATGKVLFSVADLDNIYLRAYITADQLSKIKLGDKVKVYSDYENNNYKEYEGTVSWISNQSEFTPKTIQTRNERANLVYATKIRIKNDGLVKIGMYGEISLSK